MPRKPVWKFSNSFNTQLIMNIVRRFAVHQSYACPVCDRTGDVHADMNLY